MKLAIQAAEDLEKEGISVEVIDLRTVRPLDFDTILASVKKTNRLVILEEAWPFGSVSSEITYMVQQKAFDYLDAPIKRITTPDAPAPYSAALFAEWFPKLEKVKEEIKKAMYVK
jgi:pyruvate dehydrogenase E1 component beta subunit